MIPSSESHPGIGCREIMRGGLASFPKTMTRIALHVVARCSKRVTWRTRCRLHASSGATSGNFCARCPGSGRQPMNCKTRSRRSLCRLYASSDNKSGNFRARCPESDWQPRKCKTRFMVSPMQICMIPVCMLRARSLLSLI